MLNFTAIDFETANAYRGSPCSVGLVKVRDGQIVGKRHWLIRPPEGADWFDSWNVAIHGITAEAVTNAPRWKEVLPHLVDFIDDDVVVAHNAAFDTGVIRYACAVDNIEWPEFRFLCTRVMARRALALPTYRLPYVAEHLGYILDDHHDALSDAFAVIEVVSRLANQLGVSDVEALAESVQVRVGQMSGRTYRGSVSTASSGRNLVRPDLNSDADPGGYLYGRVVVFTGKLMSMTRQIAWDECSRIGALAEAGTTRRTNVLVVGDITPATLRPGSELTGKTRKAFELQDKGQEIEVMTENDFLRCLDGNRLEGVEILLDTGSPEAANTGSHPAMTAPSRERSIPLADRRAPQPPKPAKPPRALRRTPVPTDQICSAEGCTNVAAFKTRTKPTWCSGHIEDLQRVGGLRPLEPFTHPNDFQLTECLNCSVQAHYRFNYTLQKNDWNEATCRACYWRQWASDARRLQGTWANMTPVPYEEAKAHAEENGFDYLGPLTAPSYGDDPHRTKCRRCGRISAERLGDISFGCPCKPRS